MRTSIVPSRPRLALLARILLATVGSYGLAAGLSGLAALGLASVLAPADGAVLAAMLAYPLWLAAGLYGFADRHLDRVALILGAGGATLFATAVLTSLAFGGE